jgi:alginate O-acetyltransferase complex protein AlgI
LFAFDELPMVGGYLRAMSGLTGQPLWDDNTLYFAYTNAILLIVLIVASMPRRKLLLSADRASGKGAALNLVWCGLLFFLSVSYLVDATFNPFLYFRF